MGEKLQKVRGDVQGFQTESGELRDKLAAMVTEFAEVQDVIKATNAELSGLRKEVVRLREELAQAREAVAAVPSIISPTAPFPDVGSEAAETDWFEHGRSPVGLLAKRLRCG